MWIGKIGVVWLVASIGLLGGCEALWGAFAARTCASNNTCWQIIPDVRLYSIWGSSSPTDIWVGSENGTILRGDGNMFSFVPSCADHRPITGIWGSSPNDVWAVGDKALLMHWEGDRWTCDIPISGSPPAGNLTGIAGVSASNVVIVSDTGGIWSWDGASWRKDTTLNKWNPGTSTCSDRCDTNTCLIDRLNGVFAGGSTGDAFYWAPGNGGTMLTRRKATDPVWCYGKGESDGAATNQDLLSGIGFSRQDVYAVGRQGTIIVHQGGSSWSKQTYSINDNSQMIQPMNLEFKSIWGVDRSLQWIVASYPWQPDPKKPEIMEHYGAIFTISQGQLMQHEPQLDWIPSANNADGPNEAKNQEYYGIWGPSRNEVWVTGSSGRIQHRRIQ